MVNAKVLNVDEIVARFRGVYVLLDRCRFSEKLNLTHARVVHSSGARDEVYDVLRQTPNSIIIYLGPGAEEYEGAFLDQGQTWSTHRSEPIPEPSVAPVRVPLSGP